MATRTDIILQRLSLRITRRRGTRAWMLCPFHQDHVRDPLSWGTTFFVRTGGPRAGNYHCFVCKLSGSLTALVMHLRGCEYKEAAEFVRDAGKGWKPPKAKAKVVRRRAETARSGFHFPDEVIFGELEEWDTLPRAYVEERGITPEEVRRHGIGFAIDGPLSCRIVFPVRLAPSNRIVSYSARTFVDEEPKYRTPHEREHADLDAIFGENLWPPIGEERRIVAVTEGAIDKIAVERIAGDLLESGSIGGSDVRPGHIVTLATFGMVIVLTDNDKAGNKAARELRIGLGRHVRTERVRLPPGRDAAKLALVEPGLLRTEVEDAIKRAG